jgi:hemerythrin
MVIEWKEEYSVNVQEIDAQHKRFIGLMDKLYTASGNFTITEVLGKILDELLDYAQLHFKTEEKYFDKFNYALSEEHKSKHKELLSKIEYFLKAHLELNKDVSFELLDFLEDWLVDHLSTQDKKYMICFNENGLF